MKHSTVVLLQRARSDRETHASECPLWDYEGSDCTECEEHDRRVRELRRRFRKEDQP